MTLRKKSTHHFKQLEGQNGHGIEARMYDMVYEGGGEPIIAGWSSTGA